MKEERRNEIERLCRAVVEQLTLTDERDLAGTNHARQLVALLTEELAIGGEPATAGKEAINRPQHYTSHPSGIECVDINETFTGNVAAAIKHAWRRDLKHATPTEDIKKMGWYLNREYWRSTQDIGVPETKVPFLMGKVVQAEPSGSPLRVLLEALATDVHPGDACLQALETLGLEVKVPAR